MRLFVRTVMVTAGVIPGAHRPHRAAVVMDKNGEVVFNRIYEEEFNSSIHTEEFSKNIKVFSCADVLDAYSEEATSVLKSASGFSDNIFVDSIGQFAHLSRHEFSLDKLSQWARHHALHLHSNIFVSHLSSDEEKAKGSGFNYSVWVPGAPSPALSFISNKLNRRL